MHPGKLLVLCVMAFCFLAIPVRLSGAKFARVDYIGRGVATVKPGTLKNITTAYFKGRNEELRTAIVETFTAGAVTFVDPNGDETASPHIFDFVRNYYSVLFLAESPLTAKPELVRVLLYPSGRIRMFSSAGLPLTEFGDAVLAEDSVFYELFISSKETDSVGSIYSYVEVESALHAQLLKAFKMIDLGAVATQMAVEGETFKARGLERREAIYLHVSRVSMPGIRGNLTIDSTLNPSAAPTNTAGTADPSLTNKTIYTATRLERWSVGTIAAGMVSRGGDTRAKLSSGKVEEDPLSGTMTIASFYWHFRPYFSGTVRPSGAERVAALVGYVATPAPGAALGFTWLAFRGLTVNAGYAAMFVDKAESPTRLERGYTTAGFVGLGYDFQ